jgi:hypothetical protein
MGGCLEKMYFFFLFFFFFFFKIGQVFRKKNVKKGFFLGEKKKNGKGQNSNGNVFPLECPAKSPEIVRLQGKNPQALWIFCLQPSSIISRNQRKTATNQRTRASKGKKPEKNQRNHLIIDGRYYC